MKPLLLVAILLLAGCSAPGEPYAPGINAEDSERGELIAWTTFQGNNMGWGYHPDAQVPYCMAEPYEDWRQCVVAEWKVMDINQAAHGAAKSSATLHDGIIYVGADTGKVHAFNPDGTEIWQVSVNPSKNGVHATPTLVGDTLYISAYDGAVYAFDRHDGSRQWRTQVGSWIGSSPRYHEGDIYIAVEHGGSTAANGTAATPAWGDVQILDAATGEIQWRSEPLGSHPHSTIAISDRDNVFVVGANDERVYAWDLDDREQRWVFEAGDPGDVKGAMLIWDGAAFFGSWDHNYYRVDLKTGQPDWVFETGDWAMTGSAVDPTTGTIYFGSHDHFVYAVDGRTGQQLWSQELGAHLVGSPTIAGKMLLFGASDYAMHAFDKDDGKRLWSYPTKHRVSAAPLIVGDRIVFADRSESEWGGTHGILYSLAPV